MRYFVGIRSFLKRFYPFTLFLPVFAPFWPLDKQKSPDFWRGAGAKFEIIHRIQINHLKMVARG